MIEVKPTIKNQSKCPYGENNLEPLEVIWHGMHVCVKSKCPGCNIEIIEDIRVGHAVTNPYQVDFAKGVVFGNEMAKGWLGVPLLKSLQNPDNEEIKISKEVFKSCKKVIILNCIDYLYGHSLLKLLNAQRHLEEHSDYGLVVIVQKMLRWMVPEEVAEIWTVNISLKMGQGYYPKFDEFVQEESKRFEEIYVSQAHSHPSKFDISRFTRIAKHNLQSQEFRITFIWREDRIWCNHLLFRILRKIKLLDIALTIQNHKIRTLLKQIKDKEPSGKLTIVGLGKKTNFPEEIADLRVDRYNETKEKEICQVYAESRLVIGVHGSNMLLPSGHAGMTIDLMPNLRWGNFAQDILYQESDPRLAAFRYRYLPIQTKIYELADIAVNMIREYSRFKASMMGDK